MFGCAWVVCVCCINSVCVCVLCAVCCVSVLLTLLLCMCVLCVFYHGEPTPLQLQISSPPAYTRDSDSPCCNCAPKAAQLHTDNPTASIDSHRMETHIDSRGKAVNKSQRKLTPTHIGLAPDSHRLTPTGGCRWQPQRARAGAGAGGRGGGSGRGGAGPGLAAAQGGIRGWCDGAVCIGQVSPFVCDRCSNRAEWRCGLHVCDWFIIVATLSLQAHLARLLVCCSSAALLHDCSPTRLLVSDRWPIFSARLRSQCFNRAERQQVGTAAGL